MRAVALPTNERPAVFVGCEPATRYYRVMTRAAWMPVLICEVI